MWVDELEVVFHFPLGVLVVLLAGYELDSHLAPLMVSVVGKYDTAKRALADIFDVLVAVLAIYGAAAGVS